MKPKSISGMVLKVEDLSRTADFYERIGFRIEDVGANVKKAYVNWFWLEFQKDETTLPVTSQYICISVDDVDEFYRLLTVDAFMKPKSKPSEEASGRKEFQLDDPDGHQLVFFSNK